MPLNEKGKKIKAAMKKKYGPEKGEQVFYASENKGSIQGVTKSGSRGKSNMPHGKHGGMHGARTPGAAKRAAKAGNSTKKTAPPRVMKAIKARRASNPKVRTTQPAKAPAKPTAKKTTVRRRRTIAGGTYK